MQINNLQSDTVNYLNYYTQEFTQVIEDNLLLLMTDSSRIVKVNESQKNIWDGDFYGLLNSLNIPYIYHYSVMRVNNLNNSSDYKGDIDFILLPDFEKIDQLVTILNTKRVI